MRFDMRSAGLGVAVALPLVLFLSSHRDEASGRSDADGNRDMIAVTGAVGSGTSVLWLIDTKDKQIAVYRSEGGKGVELVGARRIEYDLKLLTYRDESEAGMRPAELQRGWMEHNQHALSGGAPETRPAKADRKKD